MARTRTLWTVGPWAVESLVAEEERRAASLEELPRNVHMASVHYTAAGKHFVAIMYLWEWIIFLLPPFYHFSRYLEHKERALEIAKPIYQAVIRQEIVLTAGEYDVIGTIIVDYDPPAATKCLLLAVKTARKTKRPKHEVGLPIARMALVKASRKHPTHEDLFAAHEYIKEAQEICIENEHKEEHLEQTSRIWALIAHYHLVRDNLEEARTAAERGMALAFRCRAVTQFWRLTFRYLRIRLIGF